MGVTQIVLWAALLLIYGAIGVAVFVGQAVVAFSLLEVINYIEHYGLTRREIAPGEYERIAPQHSWDSSYRVSNWMLINQARHSDHNCVASKRYQSLELLAPAPQLPAVTARCSCWRAFHRSLVPRDESTGDGCDARGGESPLSTDLVKTRAYTFTLKRRRVTIIR